MASELKIFSGKCKYKDIDFTFVFDCNELRLIPPADAKDTIQAEWIMTPLVKGVYIKEDPLTMDDHILLGTAVRPIRILFSSQSKVITSAAAIRSCLYQLWRT